MAKKNKYPRRLGTKVIYAKHPVVITGPLLSEILKKKLAFAGELGVGKWVCAEIFSDGSMKLPPGSVLFDDHTACSKACDQFNASNGFEREFVLNIVRKGIKAAEAYANEAKH